VALSIFLFHYCAIVRAVDNKGRGGSGPAHSALEAFAARYRGLLTRYFARRTRADDVPDLVQDVFLRLARLEDLSSIERPEPYLFATASAALKDHVRRSAVRMADEQEPFDEQVHNGAGLSLERVLQARDATRRLEIELKAMPVLARDVFVLRVFEGQKMADVAGLLGISLRTAEKYYARAMARLSAAVEEARP
jgi:RNA polymerase sigma-70 factor (ECF subfamily)